jgi:ligand-binding sensor domain-containing protein/CheY-like chemotaxis protein/AraC-like DNA-binding protein
MIRSFLLFLMWLAIISANAQVQFMHFDTEKGLPNNQSEAILRDSYGFLWVGTYNGLSKYDGSTFQNYPVTDSSKGVYGSSIFKIFEDSKKRIWIGTHKGLTLYDRKQDNFKLVLKNICVMDIDESKDGILWISTFSGIIKIELKTASVLKKYDETKGFPSNIITQCVIDSKGILWFGTQTEGIFTFNAQTEKIQRIIRDTKLEYGLTSNRIRSLAFDQNGLLWIGTSDAGLCSYDPHNKRFALFPQIVNKQIAGSNCISRICVDSKNDIWFCQDGCLSRYNKQTSSFVRYPAEKYNDRYFQSNNICFITEDTDGNYWFGTFGSGIYCLNKQQNKFTIISVIPEKSNYLKNNIVNAFVELDNKILVGSEGGLQYFNPSTNTFTEFENNVLKNKSHWSIAKYNDELWCSSWQDGLYRLQMKTNKLTHYLHEDKNKNSISMNNIRTTALIDNQIWLATWGDGLEVIDESNNQILLHEQLTKKSTTFNKPSWVNAIFKDSKQRLWIVTMFGIYKKQGENYTGYFNDSKKMRSPSDDIAFSVFEDSRNQIWILTNSGLNKYIEKTDDFERFEKDKCLPANPMAMLEDSKQNLWISAVDGLYSYTESTGIVRKFNHRNGLLKGEFNSNAALKTSDGTMYFGSKSGFISFKPELLKSSFEVPKIVLRHLSVDNIFQYSLELSDTVSLKYSNSVVTIDVADLQDIVSNFASFEYSFDGNKTWQTIDDNHKITFSNKTPGTYFLHIKASYDNKKYSSKILAIIVIPPWWMSWWFRFSCIAILAILLYSYFRIRIRNIQKQNDYLTSLVKEKTHDLVDANEELLQQNSAIAEKEMLLQIKNDELQKTSVTKDKLFSIISNDLKTHFAGIMENATNLNRSKTLKNEKEKQQYIDSIYSSSKKIHNQIDLFLHWSNSQTKSNTCNPQNVNIETVIRENILLLSSLASAKQITIEYVFEHRFDAFVDLEMITIVLKNLVSNALKFTPSNGLIIIQTSNTADYTLVQIKDNGVGMTQDQINTIYTNTINVSTLGTNNENGTGLGLVICRDFLNLNKAKIEIASKPNEGTTVSMFLPKGILIGGNADSIKTDNKIGNQNYEQVFDDESETKLRLLIVEDNTEILDYIVGIFEPYYIIETAQNGEEGFAKALESIPDLIVTDINMPVKTGLEMCLQIQSEPVLHHIPVIILSAFSNFDMQAKGLQAGAFDFVVKPFDRTILFLKVQSVLESRAKFKEFLKKQFIQQPRSVFKETPDDKFMMKMQEVLENNFADSAFSVEKFSAEMGYSRSQFFRKLKAIIDTTPLEYLNVFRLKKAKEMLEQGSWTVSEVAYDVGFNDPHYFSICFKNHFGFPPNHFLKNKS